ncbi:MAG TPA: PAS domain-containing protein [Anaerolineales bacterium]|nr:PAS domain-containing protein [Anaerolineales bacterium]HMR98720.1 PAS domain-containing protein [Anaerolineales bacterium]HNQ93881.1 PAS domain-containing protein [Anaerolineales bacterium]HNS60225.1 PAS domain-containing protein [Anaerolineales bacterium]
MLNSIRRFFTAPVFEGDTEKTRSAKLLYQIITIFWGLPALLGIMIVLSPAGRTEVIPPAIVISLVLAALMVVTRMGWIGSANTIILAMVFLIFAYADVQNAGNIQPSTFITAFAIIMSGLLLGRRAPLVMAGLIVVTHAAIVHLQMQGVIELVSAPAVGFENIVITSIVIVMIGFLYQFVISRLQTALDEARKNARELEQLSVSLEQRVSDRTKALATSAEVSRRLASILDPQQLADAVVNQVQTAFKYYYAQIYLFDQAGENLVLTAGTGEAGAEMMRRGHSLPKGRGLVGRAAETKESILVSDTSQDSGWLPNELLPDTKAEAVVPIVIGDKVFGALDVQDNLTNDIFPEDVTLLESLASQVAISLQNARLFSEAQKFQDQFSLAVDGSNDGIWDWDLKTNEVYFSPRWKAIVGYGEDELNNGFADFEALLHPDDKDRALASVNDYLAGKLKTYDIEFRFHHKDDSYRWIRARGKAMRDASGAPYRMAGSHTDITDSKETEQTVAQRARQQEAINLISQRIQAATTIEDAMQVAARELGRALGKRQTLVALEPSALGGHDSKTVAE